MVTTIGLLCVMVGCTATRSISFITPDDAYAIQGTIISKSSVLKEWSAQLSQANSKLYATVEQAVFQSKETSQPVHVYRSASGYYLSSYCTYGSNHVLSVDNGQVMLNHYTLADGPSITECAARYLKTSK